MIGIAAAVVVAGGTAWYVAAGGHTPGAGGAFALGGPVWSVGTETDKLTDAKTLVATSEHDTENGGKVFMTATCDSSTIAIDFEYHAKDKADDAYETAGEDQNVDIAYRIDNGDVQDAVSHTGHSNTADAVFTYEMSDAKQPPTFGDALMKGLGSMTGLGPQDLRSFLHAHEIRFELPLAGGAKEVIGIYPQEASFQGFVAACNIDLKAIDEDAAKQQAANAPPSNPNNPAPNDTELTAAAQQDADVVRTDCTTGEGRLRVLTDAPLKPMTDAFGVDLRLYNGLIVAPVANSDAVAQGYCVVAFTRLNKEVSGEILLKDIQPMQSKVLALQQQRGN
ncbi:MAG TPA: hypothetical protein VG387_01190 [Rhizomicrobium sp.]|nr:hypothetical protein [Rhizomicrobium sp.]